ncbi:MAG TPA: DUF58 domain-containing protein [Allocoleopsis sp.]
MLHHRIVDWLETHWVAPAFSGWLMGSIAIFLFGAATNTMAGWLYVISGIMLAILGTGMFLPERSLRGLQISRLLIQPVSVDEAIEVEVKIVNPTTAMKTLLQVQDRVPKELGQLVTQAIEVIPAQDSYRWIYQIPAQRRGVYHWQTVDLKTAAPLGLFWCRRSWVAPATAVVYPSVLPLSQCPLIDHLGQDQNQAVAALQHSHLATEGLTRTLRPYRWGDAIRFVHWRTSARYGELRVRELETFTGGQELVICLDSAAMWQPDQFEQAVIAAASLYFYALKRHLSVCLWTALTGLVRGDRVVLETLAAVQFGEATKTRDLPTLPILWLSQNPNSLVNLPPGSRWLLWRSDSSDSDLSDSKESNFSASIPVTITEAGYLIHPDQPLQSQLQSAPGC